MEALVVHNGKDLKLGETARKITELLRRQGHSVYSTDLTKRTVNMLAPYDAVIIGGSMLFTKLDPTVVSYINLNQTELMLKPTYIFIHSPLNDTQFAERMWQQVPHQVLEHAETYNLGWDVVPAKLPVLDRIRWMVSRKQVATSEDSTQLHQFVDIISEKQLNPKQLFNHE